jgi:hypothetical protein
MSKAKDQNGQVQIDSIGTKKKANEGGKKPNASRRKFLKLGLAGAGAAAVAAGGLTAIKRMEGIVHDEFPLPVRDDFKRIDQRNQINVFAGSKVLNEKHPERNRSFSEQLKKEAGGCGLFQCQTTAWRGQHGSTQQRGVQLETGDAGQEPIPVQLS